MLYKAKVAVCSEINTKHWTQSEQHVEFFNNNVNNNIFIYCNWVVTRWQWLFYIYTKHEIGYY